MPRTVSVSLQQMVEQTAQTLEAQGIRVTAGLLATELGVSLRSAAEALRVANLQGPRGRPRKESINSNILRRLIAEESADRHHAEQVAKKIRLSNERLVSGCRQAFVVTADGAVWDSSRISESARPGDLPKRLRLRPATRSSLKK